MPSVFLKKEIHLSAGSVLKLPSYGPYLHLTTNVLPHPCHIPVPGTEEAGCFLLPLSLLLLPENHPAVFRQKSLLYGISGSAAGCTLRKCNHPEMYTPFLPFFPKILPDSGSLFSFPYNMDFRRFHRPVQMLGQINLCKFFLLLHS